MNHSWSIAEGFSGIWDGCKRCFRALFLDGGVSGAGIQLDHYYPLPEDERETGFRHEVERLSVSGLRTIGIMSVLVAVSTSLFHCLLPAVRNPVFVETVLATTAIGLASYLASFMDRLRPRARLAGSVAILLLSTVLIYSVLFERGSLAGLPANVGLRLSICILITLVSLPLHPIHMIRLTMAQLSVFCGLSCIVVQSGAVEPASRALFLESFVSMLFIMLLGIALSASVYRRTIENHQARIELVRLVQQTRNAQRRAMVAENAAVLGRLSAALSHELNSPIAVISSGVETLDMLWEQAGAAPPANLAHVRAIREDLSAAIHEATARMREIIKRMQCFSNLDGADILPIDINAVLSNVTALLPPEQRRHSRVELDLQVVPKVLGRPEQIHRAFQNLIHSIPQQITEEGILRIRTQASGTAVTITFEYETRETVVAGIDGELALTFSVSGKRVAASNWEIVTARQIIEEHAGEVRFHHEPPGPIRATVILPSGGKAGPVTEKISAEKNKLTAHLRKICDGDSPQ